MLLYNRVCTEHGSARVIMIYLFNEEWQELIFKLPIFVQNGGHLVCYIRNAESGRKSSKYFYSVKPSL